MGEIIKSSEIKYYFSRFGFCPRQIGSEPAATLGLVVVIPCHDEPDLLRTLDSLAAGGRPGCAVEVVVVVNSAEFAEAGVLRRNAQTLAAAREWAQAQRDTGLACHLLHFPNLPRKKAGVGLARKIGMDEALRRFDQVRNLQGVIACLDADCVCDGNYLVALEQYFQGHPLCPGASIYFEHPLAGAEPPAIDEAITYYEWHLRYYLEALRWAGFPHAYHTVGSSMAVRAGVYAAQGGMNTRQAGEDFYFLHKIIPLGRFGEIAGTRVVPSPRVSHRVPFGTGRAVREFLQEGQLETYPLAAFGDLRELFSTVPQWRDGAPVELPGLVRAFLAEQKFDEALAEIRRHTKTVETFTGRFFRWFDGFRTMKYLHFAQENEYGNARLPESAARLWPEISGEPAGESPRDWLAKFRQRQRQVWSPAAAILGQGKG